MDAEVPQGPVLSLMLFSTYPADILSPPNAIFTQFADDTAIGTQFKNPAQGSRYLQRDSDAIIA